MEATTDKNNLTFDSQMKNIRHEIADRLNFEFGRRGLSFSQISDLTNIPSGIIKSYLNGKREIKFDEITNLCNSLGINSVRLIFDKKYPKPSLAFRNIGHNVQIFSSKVEDAFLLIENSLPEPDVPQQKRSLASGYKRQDVIQEAGAFAARFRKKYPAPESFLIEYNIPVIPVSSTEADFDGFLISHGRKSSICINTNLPPQRILFTLLHEICHLIFDQNEQLPVDVFLPSLHWDANIPDDQLPEFFAYKFAQFYLIPYETALQVAEKFPQLDLKRCQRIVDEGRTLKDVLANVIFDTLTTNQDFFKQRTPYKDERDDYQAVGDQFRRMDFEEDRRDLFEQIDVDIGGRKFTPFRQIQQTVSSIRPSPNAKQIRQFLKESKIQLAKYIKKEIDIYSDEILEYIEGILQIELR